MGAVLEHHLGEAGEVVIALAGEIGEHDDRGATAPPAVGSSPLGDGPRAPLALLFHQRAERLHAEPVADVPVANRALVEEEREAGQVRAPLQRSCGQEDFPEDEGAGR